MRDHPPQSISHPVKRQDQAFRANKKHPPDNKRDDQCRDHGIVSKDLLHRHIVIQLPAL